MNSTSSWLQRQRFSWRELAVLTLIGIVANVYFLANYSPSIDDELAAIRGSSEVWITQGRFTTYLVETLLFPQPSIPFSPYLFLSVMMALTQMLLLRAHGMTPGWRTYAAYCLFITYPTWWLIEEFAANVPVTGIGFVLVAAALLLQAERPEDALQHMTRREFGRLLLIGVLLAFSVGAYQTLLMVFACGTLGQTLYFSMNGKDPFSWRRTFARIVYGGICLTISAVLYLILNKLALTLSGTSPAYIADAINLGNLKAPRWLIGNIALRALATYSGASSVFGASMRAAGIAIACTIMTISVIRRRRMGLNLLLLAFILGTPFLPCLLTGPDGVPLRAMVALPYVIWLCALLAFARQEGAAWITGLAAYALFQLQIINLTSQYIVSATQVQQQDRFMGLEIGRRIALLRRDDDIGKMVWLDAYGYSERDRTSPFAAADTSATRGSFFSWDNGNINRITAYFRVLGFAAVRPAPPAARTEFTHEFEQMPVWPQEGSLRRHGDYYLLKLGKVADDAHRSVPHR